MDEIDKKVKEYLSKLPFHSVPSEKTLEFIKETNNKMDKINDKINKIEVVQAEQGVKITNIVGGIDDIKQMFKEEKDNREKKECGIEEQFKDIDKKFAPKWVENAVIAVISIFALATLYYIFIRVGLPTPDSHL